MTREVELALACALAVLLGSTLGARAEADEVAEQRESLFDLELGWGNAPTYHVVRRIPPSMADLPLPELRRFELDGPPESRLRGQIVGSGARSSIDEGRYRTPLAGTSGLNRACFSYPPRSIELLTSANKTVTCFRSPSSADF